ncbi:2888_t:CDS:2 [Paraglomus brasilianum]|uniref:2888_t:CDS:1 n=1 Tax=Paraglomus brasilianum TaxID=144538 RepID=A0A9N9FQV4_9GLOM|nr:2888_t:CDS:2 [Paraglomus brasilianum]
MSKNTNPKSSGCRSAISTKYVWCPEPFFELDDQPAIRKGLRVHVTRNVNRQWAFFKPNILLDHQLYSRPSTGIQSNGLKTSLSSQRQEKAELPRHKDGVISDAKTFARTFKEVPPPAAIFGFAGTLPYIATSTASVLYASSPEMQAVIEPVQIGYGACVLSFMGAVHWGLEMAKYGGEMGYKRYTLSVVPAILAWPTMLFPTEIALTTHLLGFTSLLYADVVSASRGLVPSWYPLLRFWLTGIVGFSIVVTLVAKQRQETDVIAKARKNAIEAIPLVRESSENE